VSTFTAGAAAPEAHQTDERVISLLLSRLVGIPQARLLASRICLLVGGIYEIPGPFYVGSDDDEANRRLTARWQRARKGDGLLPAEDIGRFFPPDIVAAIADVVASDPSDFTESVVAHLTELAAGCDDDGNVLLDESGKPLPTLGDTAISHRLAAARKLINELIELRKLSRKLDLGGALEQWTADAVPKLPTAKQLGAEMRRVDRSAPTLAMYRRCLREMTRQVDARLRRTGRRRHEGMITLLRNRVILMLCGLGLRRGTVRRLRMDDFVPEFELMPGVVVPAVRLRHLKGTNVVRYLPLPQLAAQWIQEYLAYVRECGYEPEPDQPLLLPKQRNRWATHRRTSATMIYGAVAGTLSRFTDGRVYSPHTLRHMCEEHAVLAGADWLREHETDKHTVQRPSGVGVPVAAQTFADVLLDHALHALADRYGDRDTEPARQWWRWVTALGVWEYYWGDRGAPKGIDLEAVRHAREKLQDIVAQEARVQAEIVQFDRERDRLEQQKVERRRAAMRDAEQLDDAERFRVQMELDELNDEIATVGRNIERQLRQLPELELRLRDARLALDEAARTLKPVPDEVEPVLSLEALDYGSTAASAVDDRPLILRRVFNLQEFHWALGGPTALSAEQLRRYVRGVSAWQCLFDDDGTGKPKGVFRPTPHKCTIEFDALPHQRYPVEVIERLEALMRQPPRTPLPRAA
jgi:integrase